MGYGHEHCSLAWPASRIKEDKKGYELEKCSLIGDAFSIHSFVVIGCALCRGFLPQIHYHHLAARMGLSRVFEPRYVSSPHSSVTAVWLSKYRRGSRGFDRVGAQQVVLRKSQLYRK